MTGSESTHSPIPHDIKAAVQVYAVCRRPEPKAALRAAFIQNRRDDLVLALSNARCVLVQAGGIVIGEKLQWLRDERDVLREVKRILHAEESRVAGEQA